MVSEDAENVHDIRVWSRRLQQIISVLFPKPRNSKSKKLIRSLRNVRRELSMCRNLDVDLRLLQEKLDSVNAGPAHSAWDNVREHTLELRVKEFARARKRLRRLDLIDFIEKTRRLIDSGDGANGRESSLRESVDESSAEWRAALSTAIDNQQPEHLHALRLAGKRLRYRLELIAELGDRDVQSQIKSLKTLQDKLGRWHDRHVLFQFVEELIGMPNSLSDHPDFRRALESEIKNERHNNDAAVGGILKQTETFRLKRAKRANVGSPD